MRILFVLWSSCHGSLAIWMQLNQWWASWVFLQLEWSNFQMYENAFRSFFDQFLQMISFKSLNMKNQHSKKSFKWSFTHLRPTGINTLLVQCGILIWGYRHQILQYYHRRRRHRLTGCCRSMQHKISGQRDYLVGSTEIEKMVTRLLEQYISNLRRPITMTRQKEIKLITCRIRSILATS